MTSNAKEAENLSIIQQRLQILAPLIQDVHNACFNLGKFFVTILIAIFCFSVSILVNMSVNIIAGAALYDSTRIYVDMFVVGNSKDKMYIYRNYKTFQN